MSQSKDSLIRRYEHTADHYQKKGKREWAYAKNEMGGEHFAKARDAFDREKRNREKAQRLRNER